MSNQESIDRIERHCNKCWQYSHLPCYQCEMHYALVAMRKQEFKRPWQDENYDFRCRECNNRIQFSDTYCRWCGQRARE